MGREHTYLCLLIYRSFLAPVVEAPCRERKVLRERGTGKGKSCISLPCFPPDFRTTVIQRELPIDPPLIDTLSRFSFRIMGINSFRGFSAWINKVGWSFSSPNTECYHSTLPREGGKELFPT